MITYSVFIERAGDFIKYKISVYMRVQANSEVDAFKSDEVQEQIEKCYGRKLKVTIHKAEHPKEFYKWEVLKTRVRRTQRVEALGR